MTDLNKFMLKKLTWFRKDLFKIFSKRKKSKIIFQTKYYGNSEEKKRLCTKWL